MEKSDMSMNTILIVDGRTWHVQPSFFYGCIDLVFEDETVTFFASATKADIIRELKWDTTS